MNRVEFLGALKEKLRKYDADDVNSAISYYDELILDKVSEGKNEEEVVESLGNINTIVSSINGDFLKVESFEGLHKGIMIVLKVCFTSTMIPIAFLLAIVYFVLFVTFYALVISFGATTICCLGASVLVFFTSNNIGTSLMVSAICLILTIGFGLFTYYMFILGYKYIRKITIYINKKVHEFLEKRR